MTRKQSTAFASSRSRVLPDKTLKSNSQVSVLASICYRTSAQSELQQYILEQRESLSRLIEILEMPPGLPGQNANHFNLHPQGTVYEVTPEWSPVSGKARRPIGAIVHNNVALAAAQVTVGPPPADLTPYLAETIPALGQDPVYLGDDMQLRFNRSYGPEMYMVSGYDFRWRFWTYNGNRYRSRWNGPSRRNRR